jgi:hypothetical protein
MADKKVVVAPSVATKKGFKRKPQASLHPPQSADDAALAGRAFAAQKQLRVELAKRIPDVLVGLSLGLKGYTLLVFLPEGLGGVALPVAVDGFPVERRAPARALSAVSEAASRRRRNRG